MAWLIDGFNLIYKFPDLEEMMYESRLNDARDGLLVKLAELQRLKKNTVLRVVFDGKKNKSDNRTRESKGTIDIYYSLDYSADHLIKEFIKKDPNPRMTTVVTSDKDIIFYINRFRAKNMTSEEFAKYLESVLAEEAMAKEPEKEENPSLSDDDITFWQKLFRNR